MPYLQTALVPSGLYLIFSFTEKWGDIRMTYVPKRGLPTILQPPSPPRSLLCDRMPSITLSGGGAHSEKDGANRLLPTPVSNLIFSCSQRGGFCKYINYHQSWLIRSLLSEGAGMVKSETPTDLDLPRGQAPCTLVGKPFEGSEECQTGKLP